MGLDDQSVAVTNAIGSQDYVKAIGNLQNQAKCSEIPYLLEILEDMAASLNKRSITLEERLEPMLGKRTLRLTRDNKEVTTTKIGSLISAALQEMYEAYDRLAYIETNLEI